MKKLIQLLLLTIVFLQSTFALSENLDDTNPDKVDTEERAGWEKLMVKANQKIAKDPKGMNGYYTRAVCYWKLKALDKALSIFKK